jgi:hypothetical protein
VEVCSNFIYMELSINSPYHEREKVKWAAKNKSTDKQTFYRFLEVF